MSPDITSYSTNDLKEVLLELGFLPGEVTSDGYSIEYSHPERSRNFSNNNTIFLPIENIVNRRYATKLLDDLLSFGFTESEIFSACSK